MSNYGGNTEFYNKVATSSLTLRDVFSDMFKKHRREDGERLFIAGTSTTTPNDAEMLREWRKPWLFLRLLGAGIGFIILLYLLPAVGLEQFALVPLILAEATVVPLTVIIFYWEMNIPRNIPVYEVLMMFLVGGAMSILFTGLLGNTVDTSHMPAQFAAFIEEPAKLVVACLFLRNSKYRYTLNGVLVGGAVGCGFAVIETIGYALHYGSDTLLVRGLLAPGGHVLYAAIYAGALAGIKGADRLQVKHLFNPKFLAFFAASIALHFVWNDDDITTFVVPVIGDFKYAAIIAVGWGILLFEIKGGIREVLFSMDRAVTLSLPSGSAPSIYGLAGQYAGMAIPLSCGRIVFGRDQASCNLLFASDTQGVSRLHCTLTFDGQNLWLSDNNSSNGTFLTNGERLSAGAPMKLQAGQRFYLANTKTMFEVRL